MYCRSTKDYHHIQSDTCTYIYVYMHVCVCVRVRSGRHGPLIIVSQSRNGNCEDARMYEKKSHGSRI